MTSPAPEQGRSTERAEAGLRIPSDLLAGIVMVAFGAFFLVNSGEDMRDWIWPRSLAQLLIGLGIALAVRGVTRKGRQRSVPVLPVALSGRAALRRGDSDVLLFAVAVVAYVALMNIVGFWLLTFLVVAVAANLLDPEPTRRKRIIGVVAALVLAIVGYVLFEVVFYVPFPGTPGLPF
jgi:hypothetical protein